MISECVLVDVLMHQLTDVVMTWMQNPVYPLIQVLMMIGVKPVVSLVLMFTQHVIHLLTTYIPYAYVIVMMEKQKNHHQSRHQNQMESIFLIVIMLLSTLNVIILELKQLS